MWRIVKGGPTVWMPEHLASGDECILGLSRGTLSSKCSIRVGRDEILQGREGLREVLTVVGGFPSQEKWDVSGAEDGVVSHMSTSEKDVLVCKVPG